MKNETQTPTKAERLTTFLNGLNLDIKITDFIDIDDDNINNLTFDDITQAIEDNNGFDQEVIYYGSAMEYLTQNDPSLRESLGLAQDMGFDPKNLNSEILASLLKTENARNEYYEQENEITAFIDELNSEA